MSARPALVVGLTGGIASGKSAAAEVFRDLDVPVLDADQVARDVVAPGQPALADITRAFSDRVLNADGGLDRGALRRIVFADPARRKTLEGITHPAVRERMWAWLAAQAQAQAPYAVLEVPLLVETGLAKCVDRVLVVDVPPAVQVARVVARDGGSADAAQAVLRAQVSREERLAAADDVLANDGSLASLVKAVGGLHASYLGRAQQRRVAPARREAPDS